jgi:hypothetical protein
MKRIMASISFALASLALVSPVLADGREANKHNISEYCSDRNDLGLSHGACVAYLQNRNVAPHDASVCQDEGIRQMLGTSNHGECVTKLADMRR